MALGILSLKLNHKPHFCLLTDFFTGFNRVLHTYHGYVPRINRLERNRVLNLDDSGERARMPRHILRILLEVATH